MQLEENQTSLNKQSFRHLVHPYEHLKGPYTPQRISARVIRQRFSMRFFVFTPKRFLLTMSRVNMQIHSLTLDGT